MQLFMFNIGNQFRRIQKFLIFIIVILLSLNVSVKAQPMGGILTYVEEQDGTPSGVYWKLIFPNDTVTDNGDGTVTISVTGTGGGDITDVGDATTGAAFTANGPGNVLYFEGPTADDFETILQGQDVTADVTLNLPTLSGTLLTKEQIDTEAEFESLLFSVVTPSENNDTLDDLSDNSISDLSDVTVSSPSDGQLLKYNGTSAVWENWTPNYLTSESDPVFSAMDTEAELESHLTDVTNVYTNNDGSLSDDDLSDNKLSDLSDVGTVTYTAGQYLRADGTSYVSSSIQDGDLPDTITRDSEWDTIGEIETATGVNIIVDTEIDTSAELASIVTDETGSGALVFGTSPTFTTDITTPKVKNSGDITIDAISSSANTTVNITNSDATYVANLAVEGSITEGGNGVLNTSELDTEAELESLLTDVTNVYTNNDGALTDDDLSDNSINDLSDVDTTGVADGKILKYNGTSAKWEIGDDADTTYSAGTGLALSGTTFSLSHLGLESLSDPNANRLYYWDDSTNTSAWLDYSAWDTDASDDLTTSTSFGGDVSGTYDNLQLGTGVVTTTEIADGTIDDGDISSSADTRIAAIEVIIDGGGSEITTGVKADIEVPFNCTILQATALADQTGSIQVDIWKDTYANFPPDDADSITGTSPVSISSSNKSQDSTLSGWTTTISAGDILRFNVDSCSTITRCTVSLKVRKD